MKNKIILWLTAGVMMTSCNLFIEDENEPEFKNVPVHEGVGYDAPVTVNDSGCEVTYQYNSDVRVLSDEEQRYIASVQMDPAGAFVEIHYRKDTPKNLLPVKGEILSSGVTDLFPWGCNHRVQYRVDEDGVYKYMAYFAMLDETYKELKIQGSLTTKNDEEYYVEAVPEDEEQEAGSRACTRADDDPLVVETQGLKVTMTGTRTELSVPLAFRAEMDLPKNIHGVIDLPADENYYKVVNTIDFNNFNLAEGDFLVRMKQTVEEKVKVNITGGYSKNSWRIKRWRPVKGKAFTIGTVVLVFFINIDLKASVDLEVTASFNYYKKSETTYDVDLYEMTVVKDTKVLDDTGWQYPDIVASLSFSLSLEIQFGLGIFGKVISVRFVPTAEAKLSFANPILKSFDNTLVADLTQPPGPSFEFSVKLKLGVYLDLSLKNIINSWKQVGSAESKKLLQQAEADARETSAYYQSLVDEDNELYDPNRKDKNGNASEGDDEYAAVVTFNIYSKKWDAYWYPAIYDATLGVDKVWNSETLEMEFFGHYKVKQEGVLGSVFQWRYEPRLCIKKGNRIIDYYKPIDSYGNLKEGETYRFRLPTMDDDETYSVAPCYFLVGSSAPVAVDKFMNFNATSPYVSLQSVVPKDCYKERAEQLGGFNGKNYKWHFKFATYVQVRGFEYLDYFGVKDETSNADHRYNAKTDKKGRDGLYELNWNATKTSNNSTGVGILVYLYSYFAVQDGQIDSPNRISLTMNDERTYSINDMGVEEEGSYARRRTWSADDDDGPIEMTLESIRYVGAL